MALLAKYAWPWLAFAALVGVIGYGRLALASKERTIVRQESELDANAALLAAREVERSALMAAIEDQNAKVEELQREGEKETVRTVERVRTVIVRDKRTFNPKNVKELNAWLREMFGGF